MSMEEFMRQKQKIRIKKKETTVDAFALGLELDSLI